MNRSEYKWRIPEEEQFQLDMERYLQNLKPENRVIQTLRVLAAVGLPAYLAFSLTTLSGKENQPLPTPSLSAISDQSFERGSSGRGGERPPASPGEIKRVVRPVVVVHPPGGPPFE